MEKVADIMTRRLDGAIKVISGYTARVPSIGVILGSGQGGFSSRLRSADYIPYRKIPFFFQPVVPGHEGIMSIGELNGCDVAVLEGRIHFYEGYFMREIVFPVRILHRMGVRDIIICNAAGGISPRLSAGQIMIISDHINLMGANPLVGQIHQKGESPFLSMAGAYHPPYREIAAKVGAELGEDLAEGILAAVSGPTYETPAESRMLKMMGADAVTMSTIPEVIMARFLGIRVLGLSLITNLHKTESTIDHGEVLNIARQRIGVLMEVIARLVQEVSMKTGNQAEIVKEG